MTTLIDLGVSVNFSQNSPLSWLGNKAPEISAKLLNAGAEIGDGYELKSLMSSSKDSPELATAMLLYAVKNNKPELATELIETTECDILAIDGKGKSVLEYATAPEVRKIVEPAVIAKLANPIVAQMHNPSKVASVSRHDVLDGKQPPSVNGFHLR